MTLELIMSDPDWLGNPPEEPYWADDGRSVFYFQKVPGEEYRDLVQVDLVGGRLRTYGPAERGEAEAPGVRSRDGRREVWGREGDLFVKDLTTGAVSQLTRTAAQEAGPVFSADGRRVIFQRGAEVFVRDLDSGLEFQPAELRLEEKPPGEEEGFLDRQQERLIDYLREAREEEEKARERERRARRLDPTRVPPAWYLGEDVEVRQASLSPAERWMILVLGEKDDDRGRRERMPAFVTEDGYVEAREVRPKVGSGKPAGERLVLLDLETHESHLLASDALPGIFEDPLAELRRAAKRRAEEEEEAEELEVEDLEPVDLLRPEEEEVIEREEAGEEGEEGEAEEAETGEGETEEEEIEEEDAQEEETEEEGAEGTESEEDEDEADVEPKEPEARRVEFAPLVWSEDGRRVAIQAFSLDNKDRWIATVDFEAAELVPVHRLHDPAWVSYDLNELGWLPDGDRLWYLSEESGFSQVYLADLAGTRPASEPGASEASSPPSGPAPEGVEEAGGRLGAVTPAAAETGVRGRAHAGAHRRLSAGGEVVVSQVQATRDGAWLYYQANAGHPGVYEIWRVEVASGHNEQVTDLGGISSALLSPDESRLLITHSAATHPPELYVQAIPGEAISGQARSGQGAPERASAGAPAASQAGAARRLTHTASREFEAIEWKEPEIVAVPSSQVDRPVYARLYLPEGAGGAPPGSLPAVFFVHGAGYLQNAHAGWSDYFREFLFHTFLTRRGYAVLDMDYRASAGYGRDWRTAIYRHMGGPELDDLADGVAWLTANHPVDRERIGVYGGSYGGFLTFMALFTRPELFAAGAALRPVTDWAHYNHGYTSNILNTPELDPEAYRRSSPIEFADGLEKPLLICAPMVDDNVFFQDTVRLVQRLIELGKEDWEVAIYPVEPHAFRRPSSWLDEYRRIFKLFEENLKNR